MLSTKFLFLGVFSLGLALGTAADKVTIIQKPDLLRVELEGKLFTEYHFSTNAPRPYFYPVHGPKGAAMTRNWPMKDVPDEEHDHPHHRSLWFTHGDVNGMDFWSENPLAGRIVHRKFTKVSSGKSGEIRSENDWVSRAGKLICKDERIHRFEIKPEGWIMDFEITLFPVDGPLKLGDTKEGSMAIRLAETMRVKGKVGKGHIINSEGLTDGATWGKRAKWVDYYGPVEDKIVGVAMFDHPTNPRHPTWWHVRDYGLFAANPFGVHDFEKKAKGVGNLEIPANEKVTFRYRLIFHEGDHQASRIPALYEDYAGDKK